MFVSSVPRVLFSYFSIWPILLKCLLGMEWNSQSCIYGENMNIILIYTEPSTSTSLIVLFHGH